MLPLHHSWVARVEFREWERRFNERAARGEFVRRDLEPGFSCEAARRSGLVLLILRIRGLLSAARATVA